MSRVVPSHTFHLSFMVSMILLAVTVTVWCTAWFASKRFHERQREVEQNKMKKTVITVLGMILSMLIYSRAHRFVKAKLAKYVGYEAPEISRGDRGPRARALSALYR